MIQCVLGRRILNKQTLIYDCQNYANLLIKLVLHLMGCWLRNFDIFKKYNITSCNFGLILNKIGRYLIIYIANSFGPETSLFGDWINIHYLKIAWVRDQTFQNKKYIFYSWLTIIPEREIYAGNFTTLYFGIIWSFHHKCSSLNIFNSINIITKQLCQWSFSDLIQLI